VLLILGKRVTASPETSTGLDEDSYDDSPEQEEDDCDDNCDDDYDDDNDNSDDESYEEKRNNETSTEALPVQQNTEDLRGYVSVQ